MNGREGNSGGSRLQIEGVQNAKDVEGVGGKMRSHHYDEKGRIRRDNTCTSVRQKNR